MNETHRIYYESEGNRHYWECQTCSSAGSVGEFGDAELAAEKFHAKQNISISRVSKRMYE